MSHAEWERTHNPPSLVLGWVLVARCTLHIYCAATGLSMHIFWFNVYIFFSPLPLSMKLRDTRIERTKFQTGGGGVDLA